MALIEEIDACDMSKLNVYQAAYMLGYLKATTKQLFALSKDAVWVGEQFILAYREASEFICD